MPPIWLNRHLHQCLHYENINTGITGNWEKDHCLQYTYKLALPVVKRQQDGSHATEEISLTTSTAYSRKEFKRGRLTSSVLYTVSY